jgi:hypothetical protein
MSKGIHKKVAQAVHDQRGSLIEISSGDSLAYRAPLLISISFNDANGIPQTAEAVAIYDRHDPDKVKLYWDLAAADNNIAAGSTGTNIGRVPDVYDDMIKLKQELVLLKNGIRNSG